MTYNVFSGTLNPTQSQQSLLVGRQEGHPACEKYVEDGGGGHWLVWMEWHPANS